MFSKAYEIASNFTFPVLISSRHFDKSVNCGLGTFVMLNDEGWFLTAAHIFDIFFTQQQHKIEIENYNATIQKIENDTSLNFEEKILQKSRVPSNPQWIVNHSFWWTFDGSFCEITHILRENDLAIGKLNKFDKNVCKAFPVLKNPKSLKIGTSLCKLGFPFYEARASFNETTGSFQIADGVLPIPRFPIDGIFTRFLESGKSADGEFDIKFIETSTPGLRGQSGGPIFDCEGNIWAIQSRTSHIPLGFSAKMMINGVETTENQFMNLGMGIHVETICKFLDKFGVKYSTTEIY